MFMKNEFFEFKIREAHIEDANVLAAAEREIAKIPPGNMCAIIKLMVFL